MLSKYSYGTAITKTVTVTMDNGERWGISQGNLTKVDTENPLKGLMTKEQWEEMQRKK